MWGIRDDRCVAGVELDAASRDRIRRDIAAKIQNLKPAIDVTACQIEFHRVVDGETPTSLVVVEATVRRSHDAEPIFTHRGEAFVRINGVNQKLDLPKLAAWLKTRWRTTAVKPAAIDHPKGRDLVQRVRRVFDEHGLEPTHLARFLQIRGAPFTISLSEYLSDAALLDWIDETKLDWIAKTFLIRRQWIDGEDDDIHEQFCFDKQPQEFFRTVSDHADAVVWDEVHDRSSIYFIRHGVGREWEAKGDGRVFVVIAIPLARFSNERTIYKYISDFQPYPWTNYARTYIQLRAWARLLTVNKHFWCFGREIPHELGEKLYSNAVFLRDVIEKRLMHTRDDWHPDDYARYPEESVVAKDIETFPSVVEFLRRHNLPWEDTGKLTSKSSPLVR